MQRENNGYTWQITRPRYFRTSDGRTIVRIGTLTTTDTSFSNVIREIPIENVPVSAWSHSELDMVWTLLPADITTVLMVYTDANASSNQPASN
jgi:hypothetical protein